MNRNEIIKFSLYINISKWNGHSIIKSRFADVVFEKTLNWSKCYPLIKAILFNVSYFESKLKSTIPQFLASCTFLGIFFI